MVAVYKSVELILSLISYFVKVEPISKHTVFVFTIQMGIIRCIFNVILLIINGVATLFLVNLV